MEVAKKYEISETNARNIFVNRRANITLLQMRKMAKDVKNGKRCESRRVLHSC